MKILFVGLGGIGQRHLRILKEISGSDNQIIAFREKNLNYVISDKLSLEVEEDLGKYYGISVFNDLDEAIMQRPDITFICNPTSKHLAIAKYAAENGSHLFIEKALSDSMEGVTELIEIAEARGLKCMVGYQMRFHPCLKTLKNLIESEELGRIIAVNIEVGEYMPSWHRYEDYRQLYASKKELGGGVIISQIHEFDYIYWLFGMPESIYTVGGHLSSLEIDVEDVASTVLTCIYKGALLPIHLHQDYLQRPPTRTCKVIAEKGVVVVDFFGLKVLHYGETGAIKREWDFSGYERNQLFIDQMKHFLKAIEGSEEVLVSIKDAAISLKMALAAKESLSTRKPIYLTNNL